jgi:sugar phosphate permease
MGSRVVAILVAGFFTLFTAFAIRYSYGLLLPEMLSSLAISKTEAGVIYSSYFLTYTLCSPLLGLLVDRADARSLLAFFVALLSLGACLMSFSTTVLQASLFFALAGLGHSACWAPVVTVVMRWVSEKRRGIALSIVDLGSAVSIAFWSLMIPWIIGPVGWRTVWVILGLSGFAAAAMNFIMIRSHPPAGPGHPGSKAAQEVKASVGAAYTTILRDRRFYLIGFSYLLISFSILIPLAFLPVYATSELKISYQSAAGLIAVIGVAGSGGKLILGHVSDRVGRIIVMMLCGVLITAGASGLAYAQGFGWLILFTTLFGIGYGTIWPVYAASARDLFSREYAGSIVGLWTLFHGLGSVLAPVLAGWTVDATGTYFWAFVLAMAGSTLSFLLLFPVYRPASPATERAGL